MTRFDGLNAERSAHEPELRKRQADYERGFKSIKSNPAPLAVSFSEIDTPAPADVGVTISLHREIGGMGGTAKEALDDWQARLDAQPKMGDLLYWRVPPEMDWSYDFARQEPVWKVYARFAIA